MVSREENVHLFEADEEEEEGIDVVRSITGASIVVDDVTNLHFRLTDHSARSRMSSHSTPQKAARKSDVPPIDTSIPNSVWVLYLVSMFCQAAQHMTEFVAWFLIKSRWGSEFTKGTQFYGYTVAISSFVPVIMNPILGGLAGTFKIGRVMMGAMMVSFIGVGVMVTSHSQTVYALGFFLYSCLAIRPLRTAYIAMATDPSVRTRAIAYLNLFTDSAKMMGVSTVKLWGYIAPEAGSEEPIPTFMGIPLDRLNLSLGTAIVLIVSSLLILAFCFKEVGNRKKTTGVIHSVSYTKDITWKGEDGIRHTINGNTYTNLMTLAFILVFMLHQLSCGAVSVSNLPVLSERFQLTDTKAASIKLIQDVLPMPTPLLVAYLSKYLSDRTLLLMGFGLAHIAIITFGAPPGQFIWQPIVGMAIGHASQSFFFTAGFSLFSKVFGVRATGFRMAMIASAAALGSTCGNVVGGSITIDAYGEAAYLKVMGPTGLALMLCLFPPFFKLLNPDSPTVSAVLDQWKRDNDVANEV